MGDIDEIREREEVDPFFFDPDAEVEYQLDQEARQNQEEDNG